jgi:hypothetical protein
MYVEEILKQQLDLGKTKQEHSNNTIWLPKERK